MKGFLFLFSKSERDFIAHRQSMNSCSSCFPWFEFCLGLMGERVCLGINDFLVTRREKVVVANSSTVDRAPVLVLGQEK